MLCKIFHANNRFYYSYFNHNFWRKNNRTLSSCENTNNHFWHPSAWGVKGTKINEVRTLPSHSLKLCSLGSASSAFQSKEGQDEPAGPHWTGVPQARLSCCDPWNNPGSPAGSTYLTIANICIPLWKSSRQLPAGLVQGVRGLALSSPRSPHLGDCLELT